MSRFMGEAGHRQQCWENPQNRNCSDLLLSTEGIHTMCSYTVISRTKLKCQQKCNHGWSPMNARLPCSHGEAGGWLCFLFSTIAGFIDLAEREKQASQPGGKSASSTVEAVEQELQAHTGLPSWGPTSLRPIVHHTCQRKQTAWRKRGIKMAGITFLRAICSGHILSSLTPVLFITWKSFPGLSLRLFSSLYLTKIYLHTTLPFLFEHSFWISTQLWRQLLCSDRAQPSLSTPSGGRVICCGRGILDMVQAK